MTKLRLAAAALLAAAVTLMSSAPAQAYPDPTLTITIPSTVLYGGDPFAFQATASSPCITLTVTYDDGRAAGETATRSGTNTATLTGSYDTRVVPSRFQSPITATCTFLKTDDVGSQALSSVSVSATVTLLPRTTPDGDGDGTDPGDDDGAVDPGDDASTDGDGGDDGDSGTGPDNGGAGPGSTIDSGNTDTNGFLPNTGGAYLALLLLGLVLMAAGATVTYATRRRTSTR